MKKKELILISIQSENREWQTLEPLKEVGITPDRIYNLRNEGFLQIIYEFLLVLKLVTLLFWSTVSKQKMVILTDYYGRKLFYLSLLSKTQRVYLIHRTRGNWFEEKEDHDTWKENIFKELEFKINYNLTKRAFQEIDLFLPVSKWLMESIGKQIGLYRANDNYKRIPTPVKLSKYKEKRVYSFDNQMNILTVRTFTFNKKFSGLMKFLEKYFLFLEEEDIHIAIAGEGHLRGKSLGKFESITTELGYVEDMANLYKKYDALVHFSYLDGYPGVTLEAQAAGLPIIVNNCCGMKEQVKDGKTGLIVDLNNEEEVKEKLIALKNSEELRKQLGGNGYNKVRKENNYKTIGQHLKEAIEELVGEKIE